MRTHLFRARSILWKFDTEKSIARTRLKASNPVIETEKACLSIRYRE